MGSIQVTFGQFSITKILQSIPMEWWPGITKNAAWSSLYKNSRSQLKTHKQIPCELQFKPLYILFTFSWGEAISFYEHATVLCADGEQG